VKAANSIFFERGIDAVLPPAGSAVSGEGAVRPGIDTLLVSGIGIVGSFPDPARDFSLDLRRAKTLYSV
jgi:hypothetical protein